MRFDDRDLDAEFGEARAGHQADVTAADHCDMHVCVLSLERCVSQKRMDRLAGKIPGLMVTEPAAAANFAAAILAFCFNVLPNGSAPGEATCP
ncbi:hypothetical protein AA0498_1740 [Acidomonas methanolica]|uniref:Uncharacterized protein n=1 Tax=Acidomonas methanolica NBRC 104435 TaxID=1231351 RepID=A0A023D2J6_ACIMT|nr:hypothetical protein Amme_020_026 [Acidomonas methanolica NBRC 104435]GBQ52407.1 hypothetical protein AA0498_1740 [Acidomonas methanolica]GEK98841.1 hypothetical protein AME01nite_13400 [Acidomonas methanolica NBRC 104435]